MSNFPYIAYRNGVVTSQDKPGERFKEFRERLGLTQEDLSAETGLSRQTISQVERNQQRASFETVRAYARMSPKSLVWLVLGSDSPEALAPKKMAATKKEPREITPREALKVLNRYFDEAEGKRSKMPGTTKDDQSPELPEAAASVAASIRNPATPLGGLLEGADGMDAPDVESGPADARAKSEPDARQPARRRRKSRSS